MTTRTVQPTAHYDVDATTIIEPKDRVRWAAILAGLFTSMAALIFFAVLGVAVGFAAFDPGDPLRDFGLGTGIYSIIAGLLSFFLGGFVAAQTAAVGGRENGLLHGGMVWIVTIVLIVNFLGTGIGMLLGVTTDVASAAAGAAPAVVGEVAEDTDGTGEAVATQAAGAAAQVEESVTGADVEQATESVSQAAWWALLALGLTAAAAIAGGALGARPRDARRNPEAAA